MGRYGENVHVSFIYKPLIDQLVLVVLVSLSSLYLSMHIHFNLAFKGHLQKQAGPTRARNFGINQKALALLCILVQLSYFS